MRIVLTIVLTLIVVAALGAAFVFSGAYDVAAVHGDNPLIARFVHETSERSVAARKGAVVVPAGYDTPEHAAAGAKEYAETCVICHGGPGLKPSAIAVGLNPKAPPIYNPRREPDPQEDFWFVSNGVKMTAMPGFSKSMDDDEIWDVVAFLKVLPGMPADDFARQTGLTADTVPGGKVEGGSGGASEGASTAGDGDGD